MGMLLDLFAPLVSDAGFVIDAFGILVIVVTAVSAAWEFLEAEMHDGKTHVKRHHAKNNFLHRLIFGLDFLIAGDILQSVFTPTMEKLLLAGGIVLIRAVLSFSIIKELSSLEKA